MFVPAARSAENEVATRKEYGKLIEKYESINFSLRNEKYLCVCFIDIKKLLFRFITNSVNRNA